MKQLRQGLLGQKDERPIKDKKELIQKIQNQWNLLVALPLMVVRLFGSLIKLSTKNYLTQQIVL
jgi:hypothetical protein